MPINFSLSRLPDYSIVRSQSDNGTTFPDDTTFSQEPELRNFSTQGVCRVSRVQQRFSSHAGTHADQPMHFEDSPMRLFVDSQYSGNAVLLDVSGRIQKDGIVTRAMIEDTIAEHLSLSDSQGACILLRTNTAPHYSTTPQTIFPYLDQDVAGFAEANHAPMIAIDTPSVDHPSEECLSGAVHGALYRARTAIVENIAIRDRGSKAGEVITFFDKARSFEDARGISEMLFIPSKALENRDRGW